MPLREAPPHWTRAEINFLTENCEQFSGAEMVPLIAARFGWARSRHAINSKLKYLRLTKPRKQPNAPIETDGRFSRPSFFDEPKVKQMAMGRR